MSKENPSNLSKKDLRKAGQRITRMAEIAANNGGIIPEDISKLNKLVKNITKSPDRPLIQTFLSNTETFANNPPETQKLIPRQYFQLEALPPQYDHEQGIDFNSDFHDLTLHQLKKKGKPLSFIDLSELLAAELFDIKIQKVVYPFQHPQWQQQKIIVEEAADYRMDLGMNQKEYTISVARSKDGEIEEVFPGHEENLPAYTFTDAAIPEMMKATHSFELAIGEILIVQRAVEAMQLEKPIDDEQYLRTMRYVDRHRTRWEKRSKQGKEKKRQDAQENEKLFMRLQQQLYNFRNIPPAIRHEFEALPIDTAVTVLTEEAKKFPEIAPPDPERVESLAQHNNHHMREAFATIRERFAKNPFGLGIPDLLGLMDAHRADLEEAKTKLLPTPERTRAEKIAIAAANALQQEGKTVVYVLPDATISETDIETALLFTPESVELFMDRTFPFEGKLARHYQHTNRIKQMFAIQQTLSEGDLIREPLKADDKLETLQYISNMYKSPWEQEVEAKAKLNEKAPVATTNLAIMKKFMDILTAIPAEGGTRTYHGTLFEARLANE